MSNVAQGDLLPSYATGKYVHKIVWVVKIHVGTIKKEIKAVVDRTGSKLITVFPIDKVVSKSYSSYAGGSDIVLIGEQEVLFEHELNPALPSELGCPSCQAVLGVGAGSPIWLHFDKVLYTPGSILLDESADSFDYLTSDRGYVECELAMPEICVTSGRIFGMDVRVVFGANEPSLLLPPDLFDQYVNGKSLKTNAPGDWEDIRIKFPAIAGTGDDNVLVIQREHLVSPSEGQGYHLLVDKSPIPDTVIIGRSARLNVMIQIEQTRGRAKITSIKVSKHYSTSGLLAGILIALIFEFWRQTPIGTWEDFNFASPYKVASMGITVVASVAIYSAEEYQSALNPFPVVNVYVGVMVFGMIVWNIGVILMYFTSTSRNILGWVVKERKVLLGKVKDNVNTRSWNGVYNVSENKKKENFKSVGDLCAPKDRNVRYDDNIRSRGKCSVVEDDASVANRIERADNQDKSKRVWTEKQKKSAEKSIEDIVFSGDSDSDQRETKKANSAKDSPEAVYEKVYFNARLWIVASVAMESALLVLTFLIVVETRTEALWGLAGTLFILYILYRLMYNAFIIATLGRGKRSFVWSGFVVYLVLVIIATLLVAQKYVVGPTVERLFTNEEFLSILGSMILYLIVLYWAVWAGISTVLLTDKKIARFLDSQKQV